MKKLIALAFCSVLAVSALTACGGSKDKTPADMTTKPTITTTEPTTRTTVPTSNTTQPSTIPDSGYMPNQDGTNGNHSNGGNGNINGDTGNGMGGTTDNGTSRSNTHAPSIIGGSR